MLYKCAVQIVLYAKKGNALRQSASGHRTRLTCVSFWPIETKRTQKNSTLITVVIMIVFARFTNRECILKLRMQYLHRITNTFLLVVGFVSSLATHFFFFGFVCARESEMFELRRRQLKRFNQMQCILWNKTIKKNVSSGCSISLLPKNDRKMNA